MTVLVRCTNNIFPVMIGVLNNIDGYYDTESTQRKPSIASCYEFEGTLTNTQKFDIFLQKNETTLQYEFGGIATPIVPKELLNSEFVVSAQETDYFRFTVIKSGECEMEISISYVVPALVINLGELFLLEALGDSEFQAFCTVGLRHPTYVTDVDCE